MALAHSPTENHPEGQSLEEHLRLVSEMASCFAAKFGGSDAGRYVGALHDVGKYAEAFQRRLGGEKIQVDHATAGAYQAYLDKSPAAAFAIMGHHSGLPDRGSKVDDEVTYLGRLRRFRESGSSTYVDRYAPPAAPIVFPREPVEFYFYTRFLFSALVDADWTDTGRYFGNAETAGEDRYAPLNQLEEKLDAYLASFPPPVTEINIRRNRIREAALGHAADSPGLFSLTVPTGGGKTLTSMAFALRHAVKHGLEHIIYVIPYCSILEQTGKIFRDIFGDENVLLHYSTAEYSAKAEEDPNAFVSETWDAPIILTTSVQFFESLFASRPSPSRKLHRICRSVLIFDEVQMLPIPYSKPCVYAICQLVQHFGSTALLCTATQPSLLPLIHEASPGLAPTELCPVEEQQADCFRRVKYCFEGKIGDEELAHRIENERQALCIVNNRNEAQTLYRLLHDEDAFCLTTLLTPHDRKLALGKIRERLRQGEPCRVFSTSLVEAGVDLDFPCVYRALAGLDSIIQAGGRCNREGKRDADMSIVHVFEAEGSAPASLGKNIASASRTIRQFPDDPTSSCAVSAYFDFLFYHLKSEQELDQKEILASIQSLNFRTVSERFRMIDDGGAETLYIPGDGGDPYIEALRSEHPSSGILRRAAEYAVSLPKKWMAELIGRGGAERIYENGAILLDTTCYNCVTGFKNDFDPQAIFL